MLSNKHINTFKVCNIGSKLLYLCTGVKSQLAKTVIFQLLLIQTVFTNETSQKLLILGPHLIIVPSSTMNNWQNELKTWAPNFEVIKYYGTQDERWNMSSEILKEEIEYDIILTTYDMVCSTHDRKLFRR